MMKANSLILLLPISLFLLQAGTAADTILVQNVSVSTVGAAMPVNIILDTSTAGIAGYDISIA